ncbi:AraC family transcriptional regulator (plasmid) [Fulvitalea axinellae]|uniref:AraC family transcriptional regulator n=1 Tax=Fulvitalea axinellae TaxID=1182444 RepID=A0AAU9CXH4_9BACT|nr:AraC family transcriptional regulator [Fulvitalea axinellae]
MKKNIGILIFDEAEVLDFCGPFEVFSVTSELNGYELFNVFTIAKTTDPVSAVNGLSVNPKYGFDNCPDLDILVISGGSGTRSVINDTKTLDWVKRTHDVAELTLSICSGARLLGTLGLLDGKQYCTHHEVYEQMAEIVPTGFPKKDLRFVKAGNIYTSGGISAGIDLSFHIVEHLCGEEIAKGTAEYMEYDWNGVGIK